MSGNTVPLDRAILDARRLLGPQDATVVPSLPADAPEPRHLAPVEAAPRPRRRRPSALAGSLTAVGIVLAILATQLGLSIVVSRGAYETRALEVEQRDLVRVERVLSQHLDKLASPQNLAENAAALGMVQNATPATLRLSDSAVLGDLAPRTSAVAGNLVPNSTLANMPVVDTDGLMVSRNGGQAEAVPAAAAAAPVAWEGKLPAPDTH